MVTELVSDDVKGTNFGGEDQGLCSHALSCPDCFCRATPSRQVVAGRDLRPLAIGSILPEPEGMWLATFIFTSTCPISYVNKKHPPHTDNNQNENVTNPH